MSLERFHSTRFEQFAQTVSRSRNRSEGNVRPGRSRSVSCWVPSKNYRSCTQCFQSNHKVRSSKLATSRHKSHGDDETAETTCPIADYMKTSLRVAQRRVGNTPPLPRMQKPAREDKDAVALQIAAAQQPQPEVSGVHLEGYPCWLPPLVTVVVDTGHCTGAACSSVGAYCTGAGAA